MYRDNLPRQGQWRLNKIRQVNTLILLLSHSKCYVWDDDDDDGGGGGGDDDYYIIAIYFIMAFIWPFFTFNISFSASFLD